MIAAVALVGRPSGEHRHQGAGGGRVVGRLGAGDALDGALAELLRVLGQLLLGGVRQERRDLGAARGHARRRGSRAAVPRSQGFHERRQSSRPIHGRPTGMTSPALRRRCAAIQSASPTAKIADRHHDDVDAVCELRHAEGEPLLAGHHVDADDADDQADAAARRSRGSGRRRAPR